MDGFAVHPVFVIVAAGTLVCVFARAVAHKLSNFDWFSHTLNGYRLLPDTLARPAAIALTAAEALVVVGLVVPSLRVGAAVLAVTLLALYGVAIGTNLVRGNRRIDCGCGGAGQGLSWFLVIRNGMLMALAIVAAAQPARVELGVLAWISVFCGIASLMLLMAGAEQLNENLAWLTASDEQTPIFHAPHVHEHGEEPH